MNINRKLFLLNIGFSGFIAGCHSDNNPRPAKYNVLVFLCDDLGPHMESYGDPNSRQFNLTPNFNRLARRSLQFNNSFCQVAVSGPSRASLLTGLRPDVTTVNSRQVPGHRYTPENAPAFFELIKTLPTLVNLFNQNGYYTGRFGKVHHDHGVYDRLSWEPTSYETEPDALPLRSPAEYYCYTDSMGIPSYWQDTLNPITKNKLNPWNRKNQPLTTIWEMYVKYDKDDPYRNRNMMWANMALDAIDKSKKKSSPFFIALGVVSNHDPYCQPREFADKIDPEKIIFPSTKGLRDGAGRPIPRKYYGYLRGWSDGTKNYATTADFQYERNVPQDPWEGTPLPNDAADIKNEAVARKLLQSYYASVAYTDYILGKILDKLEQTGELENTIIITFGDHGFHIFDHDIWDKTTNFHFATRSFTYLSVPGMPSMGRSTNQMSEYVDFYPTLADLCGIKIPEAVQGVSLLPLLKDTASEVNRYAFHQFYKSHQMGYTIRDRHYRYTAWFKDQNAINRKLKFAGGTIVLEEFYNLDADPQEVKNQAASPDFEKIKDEMKKALLKKISDKE